MIVTSKDQITSALAQFTGSETLAFDIETSGLLHRKDKIIGFGISDGTKSAYFAHLSWVNGQLETVLESEDMIFVLNWLRTKKLITYNGSFDLRFVLAYFKTDLLPQLWADCMLAFHTYNENGIYYSQNPFALKTVAAHYFGASATDEQALMKASIAANGGKPTEYYKADLELMAKYCMQDCKLTFDLTMKFLTLLEEEGTKDFFLTDEVMPHYREVTIPMEWRGLPLNMPLLIATRNTLTTELQSLKEHILSTISPLLPEFHAWFYDLHYPDRSVQIMQKVAAEFASFLPKTDAGAISLAAPHIRRLAPDNFFKAYHAREIGLLPAQLLRYQLELHAVAETFNLSSKHHLKKLFFEKLGEKPLSTTPTGQPQVDDLFLESVKAKYDWVPLLQDYNSLVKLKGTYYDRLFERQEDGMYYAQFFQHRTVSGRLSGDVQQLPRAISPKDASPIIVKYNNIIRQLFAARPGRKFVDADFNSLEPHIFAHVSGDDSLKDIFLQGKDFYSEIAIKTERLTQYSPFKNAENYLGELAPDLRQKSKAYALGIAYGMSGYKLHFQLKNTIEESEALVEAYLTAFPTLHQWIKNSHQVAVEDGGIMAESGRIRHFPEIAGIIRKYGPKVVDAKWVYTNFREQPEALEKALAARRKLKNSYNNCVNFQIQGLAASIVMRAAVACNRKFKELGLDALVCCNIHDQLITECDERVAPAVLEIMKQCMEGTYKISIPLHAPPVIGDNFAETH